MSSISVNGKGRPKATIQATQGDPSVPPPTIPLTVGGRNGLQPHTEGKFVWKVEFGAKKNYARLGERLACSEDLYRNGSDGLGLDPGLAQRQDPPDQQGRRNWPRSLPTALAWWSPRTAKSPARCRRQAHLNAMLRSEVFLSCFRAVDEVVRTPYYLDDFTLVQPGYHDGGPGKRILYVGPVPEIGDSMATITAFLDVMEFESRCGPNQRRRSRPHDPPAAPLAR